MHMSRPLGALCACVFLFVSSLSHADDWYHIVDESGNRIYQSFDKYPYPEASFRLFLSYPGGYLECYMYHFDTFQAPSCIGIPLVIDFPIVRSCVEDLLGYPFAEITTNQQFTDCWNWHLDPPTQQQPAGTVYRVIAAPTAPDGLFFRRWEAPEFGGFNGIKATCMEATGDRQCTFATPDSYSVGPFLTLVYGSTFNFSGFFPPINMEPTVNDMRAGAAVPVKFSLSGDQGLGVLANNSPISSQVTCDLSEGTNPVLEAVTTGNTGLTYDADSDQYTYVWKTSKSWRDTCREFQLTLVDGTTHTALFRFNK